MSSIVRKTQLRAFGTPGQVYGEFFLAHDGNPSGGGSGLPGPGERILEVFQWGQPNNLEDGRAGQIIDGVWWPQSEIVTVDGQDYGRSFAPEPQKKNPFFGNDN